MRKQAVEEINRAYRLGQINVDTHNLLLSAMEETVSWDSKTPSTPLRDIQRLKTELVEKDHLQEENADLREIISSLAKLLLLVSGEVTAFSNVATEIADQLFVFCPPLRRDKEVVDDLSKKVDHLRRHIGNLQSELREADSIFNGESIKGVVEKLESLKTDTKRAATKPSADDKESGEETDDEEIAALLASIEQEEDEDEEEVTLPF